VRKEVDTHTYEVGDKEKKVVNAGRKMSMKKGIGIK
jgi:hypothetical protein